MNKEVNQEECTHRTVEDVKEMLAKHSNGEIQRTIQNCITILQSDHVLADAIRLNLLSERIDIVKPVGWPRSGKTLNDTDMKYILRRVEKYGISSEKKIESAIRIVANENRYHPIRDYLNGLKWDRTERIPHVLHHFLGAAEDEYTCEAMKIFLLGAIKPVFQPGCKFETMLCLVGGQGVGKSTFIQMQHPVQHMNMVAEFSLEFLNELGNDVQQVLCRSVFIQRSKLVDGLFRAGLAAGQQVGNGAVALRVPNLGVALILAFHKSRVVGFVELTFHI